MKHINSVVSAMAVCVICLFSCRSIPLQKTAVQTSYNDVHFYRHLIYNHVSPYFDYRGIGEISAQEAAVYPHYEFRFDTITGVGDIICRNPESWKKHPLTHPGVYRTHIVNLAAQSNYFFFNENNQPAENQRGVYEEVVRFDAHGFKSSLEFFDDQGKPMVSLWGIHRYAWKQRGQSVIEHRYDLHGKEMPLSPYFTFAAVEIADDPVNHRRACYNLDSRERRTALSQGVASYKDRYDENGNHLEWAYFDQNDRPCPSPYGYSTGRKSYDTRGNVVRVEYLDAAGNFLRDERYAWDEQGKLLR